MEPIVVAPQIILQYNHVMNIIQAEVMDWCRSYDGPKFHAILCDPPYELGFMGKNWDKTGIVFDPATWEALAEHLHPGGFGMAFASSRGWHRLAVAIEDAGLRIHPSIFGWAFGSGFPKATRIDTQIDKAAGAEREVKGQSNRGSGAQPNKLNNHGPGDTGIGYMDGSGKTFDITTPSTDLAKAWEGHRYGLQAMKPALEPIIVFQVPYEGKPFECIVETGAGALNIDGARIPGEPWRWGTQTDIRGGGYNTNRVADGDVFKRNVEGHPDGRWPANFYLDEEGARRLGEQSGELKSGANPERRGSDKFRSTYQPYAGQRECVAHRGADAGSAARFFFNVNRQIDEADPVMYQAKASRKERDAGLEGMEVKGTTHDGYGSIQEPKLDRACPRENWTPHEIRNPHPTVKPIDLTRWLATLLLPPAEYAPRRILVPFSGSGSEMIGAMLAGWEEVVGIEMEEEYVRIARARLEHWGKGDKQLGLDI